MTIGFAAWVAPSITAVLSFALIYILARKVNR